MGFLTEVFSVPTRSPSSPTGLRVIAHGCCFWSNRSFSLRFPSTAVSTFFLPRTLVTSLPCRFSLPASVSSPFARRSALLAHFFFPWRLNRRSHMFGDLTFRHGISWTTQLSAPFIFSGPFVSRHHGSSAQVRSVVHLMDFPAV